MNGFGDALRGDGLAKVQRALAGLERDPTRLDRARTRFSHSPPPYASDRSGTTTRSLSPVRLSEEPRRKEQWKWQLQEERDASMPYQQFSVQEREELMRLWRADPIVGWIRNPTIAGPINDMARENIKKCWMEQGIWNKKWKRMADGLWKHEEPLQVESESEMDSEAESLPRLLFCPPEQPQPKSRRPKSDEDKRLIAERRVVQEREREASRPYHQFLYQIAKECVRIQDELRSEDGASAADVNTKAYENVRKIWVKRSIWNRKWGILPGMSWKHEEPFDEDADDGHYWNAREPMSHEAFEAPPRSVFGPDSPVSTTQPVESGVGTSSQQEPTANMVLVKRDTESTPSRPGPRHTTIDGEVSQHTMGQASRRSNRKPSQMLRPAVLESLDSAHPSGVSKIARTSSLGSQPRLDVSQEAYSDGPSLPLDLHAGNLQLSPVQITPRRSKRLQQPIPRIAANPTRSRPERAEAKNLTTKGSAKPRGVSKRQRSKTTRGRIMKD